MLYALPLTCSEGHVYAQPATYDDAASDSHGFASMVTVQCQPLCIFDNLCFPMKYGGMNFAIFHYLQMAVTKMPYARGLLD